MIKTSLKIKNPASTINDRCGANNEKLEVVNATPVGGCLHYHYIDRPED